MELGSLRGAAVCETLDICRRGVNWSAKQSSQEDRGDVRNPNLSTKVAATPTKEVDCQGRMALQVLHNCKVLWDQGH